MARPIHHFLKEFPAGDEPAPPLSPVPPPIDEPAAIAMPEIDTVAMRIEEAYQKGIAEGRALERQEADTQAAELSVDYERRLEETMRRYSVALADRLAGELRAGIDKARITISDQVATALLPFLRAGLTRASIESFVAELGELVEMPDGMSFDVACPRDLIEPLREALGDAMAKRGAPPGSVRCIPGDTSEIRVTIDNRVIETRLADWLARLDGVLH
jgi:hypothetical protein